MAVKALSIVYVQCPLAHATAVDIFYLKSYDIGLIITKQLASGQRYYLILLSRLNRLVWIDAADVLRY